LLCGNVHFTLYLHYMYSFTCTSTKWYTNTVSTKIKWDLLKPWCHNCSSNENYVFCQSFPGVNRTLQTQVDIINIRYMYLIITKNAMILWALLKSKRLNWVHHVPWVWNPIHMLQWIFLPHHHQTEYQMSVLCKQGRTILSFNWDLYTCHSGH